MSLPLLALLGRVALASPALVAEAVEITADHVAVEHGAVRGQGEVSLSVVASIVTARSFEYLPDEGLIILRDGRYPVGEGEGEGGGTLDFGTATLHLDRGELVVLTARYQDEGLRMQAERLVVGEGGVLRGEGVTLSTCACEPAPWSVEARELTVVLDDVARFRAGWIRVCDHRVLPVPAGAVSLAPRRTGLLPPSLAWGRDGVVASLPLMLALGPHADLLATPEWRQGRGLRGLGELRYALAPEHFGASEQAGVSEQGGAPEQGGELDGAVGWDTQASAWRGALDARHGWTTGWLRTAVDGRWTSDPDYLSDYGVDFLGRQAPWSEQLAVAALGPLRVERDSFQSLEGRLLEQRPLAGVLSVQGRRLGPAAVGGQARVDLVSAVSDSEGVEASLARVEAGAQAEGGRRLGVFRVSGQARSRAVEWADGEPWAEGSARLDATLLLWGDVGAARHLAELGWRGGLGGTLGQADVRLPMDLPAAAWETGPLLRSRWLTAGGVPLSATAALLRQPEGWVPQGELRADWGPWGGRARVDRQVQEGVLSRDDDVIGVSAGVVRFDPDDPLDPNEAALPLLQAMGRLSWRLPGPLSELRPGWSGLWDAAGGRLLSQGPSLAYRSRCDCLSVRAWARWSADREVPDLGLRVELR